MSAGMRIAVPPSLQPAVAAAVGSRARVVVPPPEREQRIELRWQRLLRERCPVQDRARAAAAQRDASVRAVLALLDGEAEAALIAESDPEWRVAWHLLEPAPGGSSDSGSIEVPRCADAWMGRLAVPSGEFPSGLDVAWGWMNWPGAYPLSAAVDRLRSAAAALGPALRGPGGRAVPVVVSFSGGPNPQQRHTERLGQTLAERAAAVAVELYSPLFYPEGRFAAAAFVGAVQRALPPDTAAVACCPQLDLADISAGIEAAGGRWGGPFRAGAERPLARLAPGTTAARTAAICDGLLRLAG